MLRVLPVGVTGWELCWGSSSPRCGWTPQGRLHRWGVWPCPLCHLGCTQWHLDTRTPLCSTPLRFEAKGFDLRLVWFHFPSAGVGMGVSFRCRYRGAGRCCFPSCANPVNNQLWVSRSSQCLCSSPAAEGTESLTTDQAQWWSSRREIQSYSGTCTGFFFFRILKLYQNCEIPFF